MTSFFRVLEIRLGEQLARLCKGSTLAREICYGFKPLLTRSTMDPFRHGRAISGRSSSGQEECTRPGRDEGAANWAIVALVIEMARAQRHRPHA